MSQKHSAKPLATGQDARSQIVVLLVGLVLGLGLGALWGFRTGKQMTPASTSEIATGPVDFAGLSETTKAVLQRLDTRVEIRFYSLLGETRAAEPLQAFAGRVEELLAVFQRAGGGKIGVTRITTADQSGGRNAALSDGLEPFNVGRGEQGYLGIVVQARQEKVALPRLLADWETALEFDLSRAIARVSGSGTGVPASPVVNPTPVDSASAEEVTRALPNLAALSLEEATQKLREAALEEFKTAVSEMQIKVNEAQQRLARARSQNSGAELEAAVKQLRQLQSEQSELLAQISRRLQARITTLERLKGASSQP
ncbi:MAG: Gldg family protein [Verrucomicrobiae bacterium]|nr:Gldg family protein [Verrucomicrobiae bacterium]